MSTEQMREDFEVFARGRGMILDRGEFGRYVSLAPYECWSAWQAALSQPAAPAPQGVAEVMDLADRLISEVNKLSGAHCADPYDAFNRCAIAQVDLKKAITTIVQERGALKARVTELTLESVKDAELIAENAVENVDLRTRIAALEAAPAPQARELKNAGYFYNLVMHALLDLNDGATGEARFRLDDICVELEALHLAEKSEALEPKGAGQ